MSKLQRPLCLARVSEQQLSAWYDGRLAPAKRRWLEGHIPTCIVCQQRLEEFSMIQRLIRKHNVSITIDQHWRGMLMRMRQQQATTRQHSQRVSWRVTATVAATLVFVVAVAFVARNVIKLPPVVVAKPGTSTPATQQALISPQEAWGSYPQTNVTIPLVNGNALGDISVSEDTTQIGGISYQERNIINPKDGTAIHYTAAFDFNLLSTSSGKVQQLAVDTFPAPTDPNTLQHITYNAAIVSNSQYAVIADYNQANPLSVVDLQSGMRMTLTQIPASASLKSLSSSDILNNTSLSTYDTGYSHDNLFSFALRDSSLFLYSESKNQSGGILQRVDLRSGIVTTILTSLMAAPVYSWPYLLYTTAQQTHLYNLQTQQDIHLPSGLRAMLVGANNIFTLASTTIFYATRGGAAEKYTLHEIDHIDTPNITASRDILANLDTSLQLIEANSRLVVFQESGGESFAWDRIQQRLVLLPSFSDGDFSGDFLVLISGPTYRQYTFIDTHQLPTAAH